MFKHAMAVMERERAEYVVAPTEADTQLVYMNIKGEINTIITNDSDPY